MLESIQIQNIGLVENIVVDLDSHITMFSGETGAGKSMLMSSILMLLGNKVSSTSLRDAEKSAHISSEWNIERHKDVQNWLNDKGIEHDDNVINIRRVIKSNGRNQCCIQGQLVTVKEMGECVELLCEIHAQHEHQVLFNQSSQLKMIDKYAGITAKVEAYTEMFLHYNKKLRLFNKNQKDEQSQLREIDYLKFAIQEITESKIQKNEDSLIIEELTKSSNLEKINALWTDISNIFSDESNTINDIKQSAQSLSRLVDFQQSVSPLVLRLESVIAELDDINVELMNEREKVVQLDMDEISKLESRLSLLETLKRKYGKSLSDVLLFRAEAAKTLEHLSEFSHNKEQVEKELKETYQKLLDAAQEISNLRKMHAVQFAYEVNAILHKLAMEKSDFFVDVSSNDANSIDTEMLKVLGIDTVNFYISANKGEKHNLISKIASGGELSRIMLAIKVISSKNDSSQTLVLDEVDAGIGGNTARVLAEYLYELGSRTQILCVTHLPVVAACAHLHYKVEKKEEDGRTKVFISELDRNDRVIEIARMIIGKEDDELAQKQAIQLLESYQ